MAFYIEIVSIGKDNYKLIEPLCDQLNLVQKEFIFKLPPKRLQDAGQEFVLQAYQTQEVFKWLKEYRTKAKGDRRYLIGVTSGLLESERLTNLFGSHEAENGIAVVSLFRIEKFVNVEEAFLSYYFMRYALSFVNPKWKSHEETRTCYFDKKINKPDLRLSLLAKNALCDECSKNFKDFFNPEIADAFRKIAQFAAALENGDKEAVAKLTGIKIKIPTIVILTAIKEEFRAITEHLSDHQPVVIDGTYYTSGFFDFENIRVAKVIARECGPKNAIASQETERSISNFKPDMMLFVGIAGSRKPTDFKVGDVIFPEKLYYYEGGKAVEGQIKARPDAVEPTYRLLELAKHERSRESWKQLIKYKDCGEVSADIGIIASGEKVVDHYDSAIGKILDANYNDTSAVEMEGYGFMKAINRQGSGSSITYGVVRGISDILSRDEENTINTNLQSETRPKNVKNLASSTAAAFAFWLIWSFYSDKNKSQ